MCPGSTQMMVNGNESGDKTRSVKATFSGRKGKTTGGKEKTEVKSGKVIAKNLLLK